MKTGVAFEGVQTIFFGWTGSVFSVAVRDRGLPGLQSDRSRVSMARFRCGFRRPANGGRRGPGHEQQRAT